MSLIPQLTQELHSAFGLHAIVAAEIECYVVLADESPATIEKFWAPVEKSFRHEGLPILGIEKERGLHQYEVITAMTATPDELAFTLARVRAIIEKYAARFHVESSFAAKPFADQPSSGMHIHLHLSDDNAINAYHKHEDMMSDALRHSLGGLLAVMAQDMPIFFPTIQDYARLNDADHVPKIFGWGVNNRYCALRIPAYPDPYDKRIEHRVACANANPEAVIAAVLMGVLKGMRERIVPTPQQYGKRGEATVKHLAMTSAG
jgi:glutamine synthetase